MKWNRNKLDFRHFQSDLELRRTLFLAGPFFGFFFEVFSSSDELELELESDELADKLLILFFFVADIKAKWASVMQWMILVAQLVKWAFGAKWWWRHCQMKGGQVWELRLLLKLLTYRYSINYGSTATAATTTMALQLQVCGFGSIVTTPWI